MNPLNINQIKFEKANVIKLRYQNLRNTTNFFRIFEIFLVFAVISRLSFQLPLALFNFSNECIRSLSIFLISPKFVFILGNAIVITLFVNSGKFKNDECKSKTLKLTSNNNRKMDQKNGKKQGIKDENAMMAMIFSTPEHQVIKIYHRSKSEKMIKRGKTEKKCCGLRRSNTEVRSLRSCGCCKDSNQDHHYPEDHMSNEEFQKTIEDFIAKQQRFLREEEFLALEE